MRMHHVGRVARWYRKQGVSFRRSLYLACREMRIPRDDWDTVVCVVGRRISILP